MSFELLAEMLGISYNTLKIWFSHYSLTKYVIKTQVTRNNRKVPAYYFEISLSSVIAFRHYLKLKGNDYLQKFDGAWAAA